MLDYRVQEKRLESQLDAVLEKKKYMAEHGNAPGMTAALQL